MRVDVLLEQASEEMEFATVQRWYKRDGEHVERSEPLVQVEAEKASYDIDAPASGVLVEVLAEPGDEVAVGGVLGTIESS